MKKKSTRSRGKLQFSRYFQHLEKGDKVAVIKEISVQSNFPDRYQGRTGEVEEKRGGAYIIKMKDNNKEKKFIIQPIHLRKINNSKG